MDTTTIMFLFICVCLCGLMIFVARAVDDLFGEIIALWSTIVEMKEEREDDT